MATVQALLEGYGTGVPSLENLLGITATEADLLRLEAPTPALGRYLKEVAFLRNVTSGRAIGLSRFEVIVEYFLQLSDTLAEYEGRHQDKKVVGRIGDEDKKKIRRLVTAPSQIIQAERLEEFTEHDTAAAIDLVKINIGHHLPHLEAMIEGVHFACTTEDVTSIVFGKMFNTVFYGHAVPAMLDFCSKVIAYVEKYESLEMPLVVPGLTHQQSAEPTTLGKKFMVPVNAMLDLISRHFQDGEGKFRPFSGKLGGAISNFTTHYAAYGDIDWGTFSRKYVEGFGLQYSPLVHQSTTFTEEAANLAVLGVALGQVIKFTDDFVRLASCPAQIFVKQKKEGIKGSSLMPGKSNAWEMEGARAMLEEAQTNLFHYAKALPGFPHEGDMQRSYLCRNIGTVFMPIFIALSRIGNSLKKYHPNQAKIDAFFDEYPGMAGSVMQTVLKREGIEGDAYREIQGISINADGSYARQAEFLEGLEALMKRNRFADSLGEELRGLLNPHQSLAPIHRMVWREKDAAKQRIDEYRRQLQKQNLLPAA